MWVALHILWRAVSSDLFLWSTASEWHFPFWARQSHQSFLWPTACESQWHYTFCTRHSHQIFSYAQQQVSDIAHFGQWSLINLFVWPTVCEWHCTFCERQSHQIFSYDQQFVSDLAHFVQGSLVRSFPMTNRMWVTLQTFWKAVSSDVSIWPTACELYIASFTLSHCQSELFSMFGDKQRIFAITVYLFFLYSGVHNWCYCNKPTDCQILVCKLFLFIYCMYA